jgi:MFS family permease
VGVKPVLTVGMVLLAIGMLWYTQLPVDGDFLTNLLPGYLIVGIAIPCAFIPVSIAALAGIRPQEAGLASGLINTSQQIGGAIGTAIASTIFITRINDNIADGMDLPNALTDAYTLAFWGIFVIGVLGVLAALIFVHSEELGPAHEEAGDTASAQA